MLDEHARLRFDLGVATIVRALDLNDGLAVVAGPFIRLIHAPRPKTTTEAVSLGARYATEVMVNAEKFGPGWASADAGRTLQPPLARSRTKRSVRRGS